MLIPTFGQQIIINQLIRLEPVSLPYTGIVTAVTLLVSIVFTLLAIRLYKRETMVIRKS
jgi:hypothetical protein